MKSWTKFLANKKWELYLFITYLLMSIRVPLKYHYIFYFNTKAILIIFHHRKKTNFRIIS